VLNWEREQSRDPFAGRDLFDPEASHARYDHGLVDQGAVGGEDLRQPRAFEPATEAEDIEEAHHVRVR